ncbi:MAG: hypothetical protein IKO32_07460 [Lachnospiraceae bacterium]|nr:hypothetical protein [Lachnospiraceae bacterium]
MDNWLAKLERKFGKYAIRNLPLYLVICYGFGYLMNIFKPEWIYVVNLNPYAILHGQVWRLVTWILVPEPTSLFFVIIVLYFYYSLGRTLERNWGSFLFNVYFFSGFILTIIGAFLLYIYFNTFGVSWLQANEGLFQYVVEASTGINAGGQWPPLLGGNYAFSYIATFFSTYYINLSIFLAFAIMFPEMKVYILFIIPIKVKIMGIIYVIILGVNIALAFYRGGFSYGILTMVPIVASLLNTLIFFIYTKRGRYKSPKEIKRQHEYKVKMKAAAKQTHHKCAICGQTEESNPNLQFRYCSKCNGNYEYCQEHLFTHQHVQ